MGQISLTEACICSHGYADTSSGSEFEYICPIQKSVISDCMPFFSIIGIDGTRALCWKGHGVYLKLTTENINGHAEWAEAGAEKLGRGFGPHMCYMYAAYSFISPAHLYLQEFSAPKLRI